MQDNIMIAGIDIGRTNTRVALAEQDGTIVGKARADTPELAAPDCVVAWVAEQVKLLRAAGRSGPWASGPRVRSIPGAASS